MRYHFQFKVRWGVIGAWSTVRRKIIQRLSERQRGQKLFSEHRVWILFKGFVQGTALIYQANHQALPTERRNRGQREHMLFNNLPFDPRKLKFLLRVDKSISSVGEGMKGMPFAGIVPVVKKVIMQKRPSYQLPLTKIQVEIPGKLITVISNSDAVQKNRGVSMLYILMGGAKCGARSHIR